MGLVGVAGGGGDLGGVVAGSGVGDAGGPAGDLLDQVVGLAEALAVGGGGGAVVGFAADVVVVGDRGVAAGVAAVLVAGVEVSGVRGAEPAPVGVEGGEDAGEGVGEESAEPAGGVGAGGEVAGGLRGDHVVADPAGRSEAPSRVSGVITSWISAGTAAAVAWPVNRWTSRSAISWDSVRSSPAAFAARAACSGWPRPRRPGRPGAGWSGRSWCRGRGGW